MEWTWSARLNGGQVRSYGELRPRLGRSNQGTWLPQLRLGRGKPAAVEILACLYILLAAAVIAELTFGPMLLIPVAADLQAVLCLVGVTTILLLLADRPRQALASPQSLSSAPAVALERRAQQLAELAENATRSAEVAEAEAAASAELLGRISHAMRTPLNAIIGFSDVMEKQLFGPLGHQRYQDYSQHIREAGFDLLGATEGVLAMTRLASRAQGMRHDETDVDSAIGEAIKSAAEFCRSRSVAMARPQESRLSALGDMRALRQALVNILFEAAAGAELGSLISCRTIGLRGEIWIEVQVTPASIDHGAGVLDQTLDSGRRSSSVCESKTQTKTCPALPAGVFRANAEGTKRQRGNTSPRREALPVARLVGNEPTPLRLAVAEALLSLQGGRLQVERPEPTRFLGRIVLARAPAQQEL